MATHRFIYPLELILTGIAFLKRTRSIKRGQHEPVRSMILYTLQPILGMFLPIGRDYKPLGVEGYSNWVEYDNYPFLLISKDQLNMDVLTEGKGLGGAFYSFNDNTYPRDKATKEAYIKRVISLFEEKNPGFKKRVEEL